MRVIPAALLPVVLLAGCGGSSGTPSASPPTSTSPTTSAKSCADVLKNGAPVVKVDINDGCTDPVNGTLVVSGSFACVNGGGELFQYSYSGGEFWGYVGRTWHKSAGKVADDPAYGKAYSACNG